MRLSNAWEKFRNAALCAVGVGVLLFCAYQIYSAVADGTVVTLARRRNDWITYQTNPGFYVFSLSIYALVCALGLAIVCGWLFGLFEWPRRRQSPDDIDNAIRLDVNNR
jgi:hypothetical protein